MIALFGLFAGAPAHAQGFRALSGRNHPELDWRVAETEHFRIVYPQRLAGIEADAAPIAERSYDALAANLDVTFDRRIDIFLSDEDEISNGFAAPIGNGHTNIWVHVSDYDDMLTGRASWLRSVISHELAHIFHYQAVLSHPRWLSFLFADPLPRFWTEGIAQYQTEHWTSFRGDRWLRTAVLDDRLSYSDGRSLWNGRLLYAIGNAQLRYLTDRYGDSTLVSILKHRSPAVLGIGRVHDFYRAIRSVTGESYRDFYDDWRRHVNIYYNTMAGQMERPDSLDVDALGIPGQYYFDASYSPDTTHLAVLSLTSLRRPVMRLFVVDRASDDVEIVAEGSIQAPFAWSPDGRRIAYSRSRRGRFGSIVRDLYIVDRDGSNRRRLTTDRRAGSPTFSPDGTRLAFSASDGGTDNVYVLDLETGQESRLTDFEADVRASGLRWHPTENLIAYDHTVQGGFRGISILDVESGSIHPITTGRYDDRDPVWSPGGEFIAYTSLRDAVPNVHIYDRSAGTHERVTALVTGAEARDWIEPDSTDSLATTGRLLITSQETKSGDRAYLIPASRRADAPDIDIPPEFASWTTHRPPNTIAVDIPPNSDLITARYGYRSWRNLRHVATGGIPYAWFDGDFGLAGFSVWTEPLGKHSLAIAGNLSLRDPLAGSYGFVSYLNNQWFPTIGVSAYRLPGSARFHGSDLLVEGYTGGDISIYWPLDWSDRPFVAELVSARLRWVDIEPLTSDFDAGGDIPPPVAGQQADVRLGLTLKKQRPYFNNVIHPLDGLGLRVRVTGSARVLGSDSEFVRGDVSAYGIWAGPGLHRLYVYGRAQVQEGTSFPQDFVGLSRHDGLQIDLPLPLTFGETERVRGFRSYALGDRMLFGSAEYRIPLLSSLQTRLLGVVNLGGVAAAAFADAGLVWSGADLDDAVSRVGVGFELKNALRIGGFFSVAHAIGAAKNVDNVFSDGDFEVYYRIRTAVPF